MRGNGKGNFSKSVDYFAQRIYNTRDGTPQCRGGVAVGYQGKHNKKMRCERRIVEGIQIMGRGQVTMNESFVAVKAPLSH
jgi:hypothetical protein